MMKLMINSTSQKLRNTLNDGINCVIDIKTPEGYVLLGGTYSQRAWLTGDETQGVTVEKRQTITDEELEEMKELEAHIFIFEDTLYLLSLNPALNNVKFPLELLDTFEKADIEITDLR